MIEIVCDEEGKERSEQGDFWLTDFVVLFVLFFFCFVGTPVDKNGRRAHTVDPPVSLSLNTT